MSTLALSVAFVCSLRMQASVGGLETTQGSTTTLGASPATFTGLKSTDRGSAHRTFSSAHPLKLGCLVCMLLLYRRTVGAGCRSLLHQDAGNTVCKALTAAWLYLHSAGLQFPALNVDAIVWRHDIPAAVTGARSAAAGGSAPPPDAALQTASLGAARSAAAAQQAPRLVACRQAQPRQRPVPRRQCHLRTHVLTFQAICTSGSLRKNETDTGSECSYFDLVRGCKHTHT